MGHIVPMLARQSEAPAADPPALEGTAGQACRVAVIGAGFSGVLVALHVLWRCRRDDRIYLVERAPRLGRRPAYATGNPRHLLNVRIENMSAFADEPDHFARWLKARLRRHLRPARRVRRLHRPPAQGLDHAPGRRPQSVSHHR